MSTVFFANRQRYKLSFRSHIINSSCWLLVLVNFLYYITESLILNRKRPAIRHQLQLQPEGARTGEKVVLNFREILPSHPYLLNWSIFPRLGGPGGITQLARRGKNPSPRSDLYH
jgi:hypothetical protein